jgi:hypothetical protein
MYCLYLGSVYCHCSKGTNGLPPGPKAILVAPWDCTAAATAAAATAAAAAATAAINRKVEKHPPAKLSNYMLS